MAVRVLETCHNAGISSVALPYISARIFGATTEESAQATIELKWYLERYCNEVLYCNEPSELRHIMIPRLLSMENLNECM